MEVSSWYIVVSSSGELVWTGNNFGQRHAAAPRRGSCLQTQRLLSGQTNTEHQCAENLWRQSPLSLAGDHPHGARRSLTWLLCSVCILTHRYEAKWLTPPGASRREGLSPLAPPAGRRVDSQLHLLINEMDCSWLARCTDWGCSSSHILFNLFSC